MNKKTFAFVLLSVAVCVILIGCETSSYNAATVRTVETHDVFVSVPMIVEYDTIFKERVMDTCTFRVYDESVDYAGFKKSSVVRCCIRYDCDILVNPSYDVSKEANYVTIIVSGFPAKYKRIRQATADDLWMLQFSK